MPHAPAIVAMVLSLATAIRTQAPGPAVDPDRFDALLLDLDDPDLQPLAIQELAALGRAVAPQLVHRCTQRARGEVAITGAALYAVLRGMGPDAIAALRVALADAGDDGLPPWVRQASQRIAEDLALWLPAAATLAEGKLPGARLRARLELAAARGDGLPPLRAALDPARPHHAEAACELLATLGPEAAPALADLRDLAVALADGPDPLAAAGIDDDEAILHRLQLAVACALAQVAPDDPNTVAAHAAILDAGDVLVTDQLRSLDCLRQLGPAAAAAVGAVAAQAWSIDDQVKRAAMTTLAAIGPPARAALAEVGAHWAEHGAEPRTRQVARALLLRTRGEHRLDLGARVEALLEVVVEGIAADDAHAELVALGPHAIPHLLRCAREWPRWRVAVERLCSDIGPHLPPTLTSLASGTLDWQILVAAACQQPQPDAFLAALIARLPREERGADSDDVRDLLALALDSPDERLMEAIAAGSAAEVVRACALFRLRGAMPPRTVEPLARVLSNAVSLRPGLFGGDHGPYLVVRHHGTEALLQLAPDHPASKQAWVWALSARDVRWLDRIPRDAWFAPTVPFLVQLAGSGDDATAFATIACIERLPPVLFEHAVPMLERMAQARFGRRLARRAEHALRRLKGR